jgi:hypothetical protein
MVRPRSTRGGSSTPPLPLVWRQPSLHWVCGRKDAWRRCAAGVGAGCCGVWVRSARSLAPICLRFPRRTTRRCPCGCSTLRSSCPCGSLWTCTWCVHVTGNTGVGYRHVLLPPPSPGFKRPFTVPSAVVPTSPSELRCAWRCAGFLFCRRTRLPLCGRLPSATTTTGSCRATRYGTGHPLPSRRPSMQAQSLRAPWTGSWRGAALVCTFSTWLLATLARPHSQPAAAPPPTNGVCALRMVVVSGRRHRVGVYVCGIWVGGQVVATDEMPSLGKEPFSPFGAWACTSPPLQRLLPVHDAREPRQLTCLCGAVRVRACAPAPAPGRLCSGGAQRPDAAQVPANQVRLPAAGGARSARDGGTAQVSWCVPGPVSVPVAMASLFSPQHTVAWEGNDEPLLLALSNPHPLVPPGPAPSPLTVFTRAAAARETFPATGFTSARGKAMCSCSISRRSRCSSRTGTAGTTWCVQPCSVVPSQPQLESGAYSNPPSVV